MSDPMSQEEDLSQWIDDGGQRQDDDVVEIVPEEVYDLDDVFEINEGGNS